MSSTSFPRASAEEHVAWMLKSVCKPRDDNLRGRCDERAERRPRKRVVLALVDDDFTRARRKTGSQPGVLRTFTTSGGGRCAGVREDLHEVCYGKGRGLSTLNTNGYASLLSRVALTFF